MVLREAKPGRVPADPNAHPLRTTVEQAARRVAERLALLGREGEPIPY